MKKCSTAALALSLAWAVVASRAEAGEPCAFLEAAPDSHRVVQGDTLWDIAGSFLANPWCWPAVWERNRDEVPNPHRIYPGQVIVFDRQHKRLGFAAHADGAPAVQQLSPVARSEALGAAPIPAFDPSWQRAAGEIRLLANAGDLPLPRILGFSESRRIAAAGDVALVDGGQDGEARAGHRRDVVRQLAPILDPDDGRVLAVPLQRVGQAEFVRFGEHGFALYRIVAAHTELLAGDLLASPSPAGPAADEGPLALHPARPFEGRVAAMLAGGQWAAQRDVVALNRGSNDGLRAGSLVAVVRQVRIAAHDPRHRTRPAPPPASSTAIATLVVLEALERASLALVLRSEDAFSVGERVRSVDADAR